MLYLILSVKALEFHVESVLLTLFSLKKRAGLFIDISNKKNAEIIKRHATQADIIPNQMFFLAI